MEELFLALLGEKYRVVSLRITGEDFYLKPLLLALFAAQMRSETFSVRYSFYAIKTLGARIVVTGNDNATSFYRLGKLLREIGVKSVSVQNARRFLDRDLPAAPSRLEDCHVDYLFCFGESIAQRYRPWVGSGQIIPHGSLKLNFLVDQELVAAQQARKDSDHDSTIAFVSEFHPRPEKGNQLFARDVRGNAISFDQYFDIDRRVLLALKDFCLEKGLKVKVLARWNFMGEESQYYEQLLGDALGAISQRKEWFSSYVEMSNSNFVITIDSTLGYEALAVGLKTICVSARAEEFETPSHRFGWPLQFETSGVCWMNTWNATEFQGKLEFARSSTHQEFSEKLEDRVKEVISFECDSGPFHRIIQEMMLG